MVSDSYCDAYIFTHYVSDGIYDIIIPLSNYAPCHKRTYDRPDLFLLQSNTDTISYWADLRFDCWESSQFSAELQC